MVQDPSTLSLSELPGPYQEIAEVIGVEATVKLCERFGGERLMVPTLYEVRIMLRNRSIVEMGKAGKMIKDIAVRHAVTRQTVTTVLKKAGVGHGG